MTALYSAVLFRPVVRNLLIVDPALKLRVRHADEVAEQAVKFSYASLMGLS